MADLGLSVDPAKLTPAAGSVERVCHFCGLPIPDDESAIQARTGNAWAHFECWYDGKVFQRDPETGRLSDG